MEYKQKNRALVIGFVILLFVAYQFSLKKTLELHTSVNKLTKEKALLSNAGERIQSLQLENKGLNSFLESNNVSADQSFEQTLFERMTNLKEQYNLKIVSFNELHKFESDGAMLLSYTIEIKGDCRNLMLFSSSLEQQRLGEFTSMYMQKKRTPGSRRDELVCKLILQKLSK